MAQTIRAYMSYISPVSWVSGYDHPEFTQAAEDEAQRILADVEPDDGTGDTMHQFIECMAPWERGGAIESLAAITADGGPLDQLAWSIPTIGQTSAIAHRNSLV